MASVNRATIIGNAGRDPEIRYLPSGMAVCDLSIATTSKRKDKNSGDYIEETQWHRVKFFDKLAEIVGKYVTKGSSVYVEGRITYGKYTDKDGIEKHTCDIIADQMQMLGGKPQSEASRSTAPREPARQAPAKPSSGFDDFGDFEDPPF